MIRVMGRVRATVRLKGAGAGAARVLVTSWASDRTFPRTTGTAVAFELETADGQLYRVDPFEAVVALPVRARAPRDGSMHEEAWLAADDELTVEGDLQAAGRGRLQTLHARRIDGHHPEVSGATTLHRLPPRMLQRGEAEKVAAEPARVPPTLAPPVAPEPAPTVALEPPAPTPAVALEPPPASASDGALEPDGETPTVAEPAPEPDASLAPRRPKKRRPDSSGTPTPSQ